MSISEEQKTDGITECRNAYSSHDCYCFQRKKSWISYFVVHDRVEHFLLIVTWEWRLKEEM